MMDKQVEPILEDFLLEYPKNLTNYRKLIGEYNRLKTASFVGAGVSKPLGIIAWKELIEELHCKLDSKIDIDKNDLPNTADKMYDESCTNGKESEFLNIVFNSIESGIATTTSSLLKLALLIDIHFTTNFDNSIENAYKFFQFLSRYSPHWKNKNFSNHVLPNLPLYGEVSKTQDAHVIYLHGNTREQGKFIFLKRNYELFYPTEKNQGKYCKKIEECLKSFLKEMSFIFIGFSFNDLYVKGAFFRLIEEIKRDYFLTRRFLGAEGIVDENILRQHFLLIEENHLSLNNKDSFFDDYEKFNIYPIVYKADHKFLEYLFEKIILETRGI